MCYSSLPVIILSLYFIWSCSPTMWFVWIHQCLNSMLFCRGCSSAPWMLLPEDDFIKHGRITKSHETWKKASNVIVKKQDLRISHLKVPNFLWTCQFLWFATSFSIAMHHRFQHYCLGTSPHHPSEERRNDVRGYSILSAPEEGASRRDIVAVLTLENLENSSILFQLFLDAFWLPWR